VRGKTKQYDRMLGVLWHCYLSPDHVTQLEAASRLGVSDSLVSDYRRRIEQELRALAFGEIEQARRFETSLRERVRALVLDGEEESVAAV
jgi:predicted transcriptional regulator